MRDARESPFASCSVPRAVDLYKAESRITSVAPKGHQGHPEVKSSVLAGGFATPYVSKGLTLPQWRIVQDAGSTGARHPALATAGIRLRRTVDSYKRTEGNNADGSWGLWPAPWGEIGARRE